MRIILYSIDPAHSNVNWGLTSPELQHSLYIEDIFDLLIAPRTDRENVRLFLGEAAPNNQQKSDITPCVNPIKFKILQNN